MVILEEKNIFPIADAILSNHNSYDIGRFFKAIHYYCLANKIKWPICKRIVTDVSFAIIGAIVRDINDMRSLLDYLNACYDILTKNKRNISFVCIQFCVSHYSKIICKDIDNIVPLSNTALRKFLREAFGIVFNLNSLSSCIKWFEQLCIVLCTKKYVKQVHDALNYLKNASNEEHSIKMEFDDNENIALSQDDKNIGNISN